MAYAKVGVEIDRRGVVARDGRRIRVGGHAHQGHYELRIARCRVGRAHRERVCGRVFPRVRPGVSPAVASAGQTLGSACQCHSYPRIPAPNAGLGVSNNGLRLYSRADSPRHHTSAKPRWFCEPANAGPAVVGRQPPTPYCRPSPRGVADGGVGPGLSTPRVGEGAVVVGACGVSGGARATLVGRSAPGRGGGV